MVGKVFYAAMAAGAAFVAIGIASSIYSNVPVDVRLDNTLGPGEIDPITPIMNAGNTASITVSGASYELEIKDPDGVVIVTERGNSTFGYDLTAQKENTRSLSGTQEIPTFRS